MATYCIDNRPKPNGDHEVHMTGCYYMPQPKDCIMLGEFPSCHEAIEAAKARYPRVNSCFICARECHRATT